MQAPGAGGSHASHHAFALFTAGSSLFQGYGLSAFCLGPAVLFDESFFAMVWQVGVIYYFSDAPFLQRYEMYRMLRMGRKGWFWERIFILAAKALFLILAEVGLSILFLASRRPELANDWGSLFYTFSMSNAVLQYQSMADFPYEFLVENSPWAAMGMLLGVGWLPD